MSTVLAPGKASSIDDAVAIKKACLGLGTDEMAIISVLGHRNSTQIKEIQKAYKEIYQEDLIQQLKSELSGSFERAISLWVLDPNDRDAVLLHGALRKLPPDYQTVIEIACIKTPDELLAVKRAYQSRYKHAVEEDVAVFTPGKIGRLLMAVISVYKYHGDEINEPIADYEANLLYDEIQNQNSNHEDLIRIMSTRSKQQLVATFKCFKAKYKTSVNKSGMFHLKIGLRNENHSLQGDKFFELLRVATRGMKNPPRYFAKALRSAIRGWGVDEAALSQVIIRRAEIDLQEIKKAYLKRTGKSLDDAVAGETSGDYKDFMLALLGN
ncbi:LOW QUALITY PROTEIN: hypothetical protein V2J09_000928 [Rumex salicifolius]